MNRATTFPPGKRGRANSLWVEKQKTARVGAEWKKRNSRANRGRKGAAHLLSDCVGDEGNAGTKVVLKTKKKTEEGTSRTDALGEPRPFIAWFHEQRRGSETGRGVGTVTGGGGTQG